MGILHSSSIVNFVVFMAILFSSCHKGTKTLRKNNKVKNPGPENQALVAPERGCFIVKALQVKSD
jgi:hypothetical protein